jgi:hypothetical protein
MIQNAARNLVVNLLGKEKGEIRRLLFDCFDQSWNTLRSQILAEVSVLVSKTRVSVPKT